VLLLVNTNVSFYLRFLRSVWQLSAYVITFKTERFLEVVSTTFEARTSTKKLFHYSGPNSTAVDFVAHKFYQLNVCGVPYCMPLSTKSTLNKGAPATVGSFFCATGVALVEVGDGTARGLVVLLRVTVARAIIVYGCKVVMNVHILYHVDNLI